LYVHNETVVSDVSMKVKPVLLTETVIIY